MKNSGIFLVRLCKFKKNQELMVNRIKPLLLIEEERGGGFNPVTGCLSVCTEGSC